MVRIFPRLTQIVQMCHLCTKKHNWQIAFRFPVAIVTPLAEMMCLNFFYNVDPLVFQYTPRKNHDHETSGCMRDVFDNKKWKNLSMWWIGLVGNVDIVSHRQDPPNDILSQHMLACWQNVGKVGPTLGKNVILTCQTTCQQDIIQDFPDMSADSFGHKEKTAKLHRKLCSNYDLVQESHENGIVCKNSCIRTIFFLKNDR